MTTSEHTTPEHTASQHTTPHTAVPPAAAPHATGPHAPPHTGAPQAAAPHATGPHATPPHTGAAQATAPQATGPQADPSRADPSQRASTPGFGARSTADDVLSGVNLTGKLAVVTGGYSGLGLQTSRALARAGARVVVPARRPTSAREALAGIDGIEVDEMDLADLESIRGFTERFLASGRDIDMVINNAGIMACPETRVGPGWEAQFAVNHLGHFALVNLLWPAIAHGRGSRVVAVTSGIQLSAIRWDDVHFRHDYDKWQAYTQAKSANALFAVQLDVLGRDAGVRAFAVSPGYILTPLQRHLSQQEMIAAGWIDVNGNQVNDDFKTPAQGAATQVWAATSAQLTGQGGVYCQDCTITRSVLDDITAVSADQPLDPAGRMWALSAELTGLNAFPTIG